MALILQFPRPVSTSEPDDAIIDLIEKLLERARDGDVQSLVVVAAGPDGHPECSMTIDRGHATTLIGALRVAEARLIGALEAIENSASE